MSWIQKLCETYDNCQELIGRQNNLDETPLLPVAHTTQMAHIEVVLGPDGSFRRASVIQTKKESQTIIPCTEKSQNRTGKYPKNYPLFDKLQYLAGDYTAFGGEKGAGFREDYMNDLRDWCASSFSHPKVRAVFAYLEKGCLIADLIAAGVVPTDSSGTPIRKWDKDMGEKRGVYQAGAMLTDSLDAFVRFDVEIPGDDRRLWMDPEVWNCYIGFYAQTQGRSDLCYATGRTIPCSDMSPKKIRNSGDGAKLISSNDGNGFTYRGRFTSPEQAYRIGYETTQKAHNALKWLIARQSFRYGDLVYVAWGTAGQRVPAFAGDTLSLAKQARDDLSDEAWENLAADTQSPDPETIYARKLSALLSGYGKTLDDRASVVVMGLDSATTGRLSIVCYEELSGSELLRRVRCWHETCAWPLRYLQLPEKMKGDVFIGAPSPEDIVRCAFGRNASDKLVKHAVKQIMPCILDGSEIPRGIMLNLCRRASNPMGLASDWEYTKTLCVACAVIRYYHAGKGNQIPMSLDLGNNGRSYLFGRVLAYYDYLESSALREAGSNRPTNALRLKPYFCRRPKTTLGILDDKTTVYFQKFYNGDSPYRKTYLAKLGELRALLSRLDGDSCKNLTDEPLDETYLLGFASQENDFYQKKENDHVNSAE